MKKTKDNLTKKGFTLVELLAVIIILAVILAIAIPTISNVIYEVKRQAAVDTVHALENAVEYKYYESAVGEEIPLASNALYVCGVNGCESDIGYSITEKELDGTMPTAGEILTDKVGNVILIKDLVVNDFICNKVSKDAEIICSTTEKTTIAYDSNGGTSCPSKTVNIGGLYGELCSPTKDDYVFAGWYLSEEDDNGTGTKIQSTSIVQTTGTLYARWTKGNFQLTLNKGTGVSSVSAIGCSILSGTTYNCESETSVTLSAQVIDGYENVTWTGGDVKNNEFEMPASNITLTANASPKNLTVEYDSNGGTSCSNKSVTYNETYGSLCESTRDGYEFGGWYLSETDNNGSGTQITAETIVNITENHKLYAKWTAKNLTVEYDSNEGTSCPSKTVNIGGLYGELCQPTRDGYEFGGWYLSETDNNGSGVGVQSTTTVTITENHKLYAKWTNETYDLTLNKGTGIKVVGATSPGCKLLEETTYSCEYKTSVTLSATASDGYENVTWTGGEVKNNEFEMPASNITLTANASPKSLTVEYDNAGGTGCTTKDVTYNGTYGTLCSPVKEGYTFNGWYPNETDNDESGNQVTSTTKVTSASNHKLYAKWTLNKVHVMYHMNGGTWGGSSDSTLGYSGSYVTKNGSTTVATYSYGQTGIDLANYNDPDYINITRTGYTAKSGEQWNTMSDGSGKSFNHSSSINANDLCDASSGNCTVTLYVNWNLNTYTVTFYNDSTVLTTQTVSHGKTASYSGATPAKTAEFGYKYTFSGWSTTNGGGASSDALTNITEDTSVYAAFTHDQDPSILVLYNEGDSCTSVTGGWVNGSLTNVNNKGTATLGTSYMTFSNASTGGYSYPRLTNIITSNTVNTTGYNYLNVEWAGSPVNSNNRLYFGVYTSKTVKETAYTYVEIDYLSAADTKQVKKINLSSYQGNYYIGGFLWKAANTSSTYTGRIYRVWLSEN